MGRDVRSWGHLVQITLVVEYNKPAVKRPRFREGCGVVYRSIRAASPCLCVFREHCLCFLSIYSSLCFSFPPLHSSGWVTWLSGHRGWPPPHSLLMQSGTWVRCSLNYNYSGPVLPLGFSVNRIYWMSCSIACGYVVHLVYYSIASTLFFWPADNSALLWITLYMWACCPLLKEQSSTKYLKLSHLLFSISVSLCHCFPLSLHLFSLLSLSL